MLTARVDQPHFGSCQLVLEGWRKTVYDIFIVGLRSFKLLPITVGKCLHKAGYGCSEYELEALSTMNSSLPVLQVEANGDLFILMHLRMSHCVTSIRP